jgi:hypothetical protein
MPTARELLEQADALMRRNRRDAVDEIPVLTDSVSAPPTFRVPLRPSPESAPIAVSEADGAPDSIPTLTDRVAGDDRAPDSVGAEGEPSDWLDLEEGNPSITGEAPDSIVMVPRVRAEDLREDDGAPADEESIELEPAAAAAIEDAFDEELAEASEHEDAEAMRTAEPAHAGVTVHEDPVAEEFAELPAADAGVEDVAAVADDVAAAALPPASAPAESVAAGEIGFVFESTSSVSWAISPEPVLPAETAPTAAPGEHVSVIVPPPAILPTQAVAEDTVLATVPTIAALAPEPAARGVAPVFFAAPLPAAPTAEAPTTAPAAPPDDAKWEAMAEEIRMQVLQRIDLFTDTGLRDQLGRRLQPIVDRASADLVATINQHVGELLRAYVAEAIEREIESWRKNN